MNNAEVLIKFKGDTKDVDNSVKGLTKSMGSLTKSITLGNLAAKGISKAFSLISSNMDSAIKRVDTLNNFPKVMSNLGISTKEADKQIKRMSEELAGLPTTLDQGAMAVQRFTSKNSDVKKSTDIFLALNNALLAGGASTDIQATALEQLSQAYAKGKPDMMEWRSIQTAMPAQLKQIATAMGYAGGNVDALGEDLRKGNVSMDKFMDTIIELNKKGTAGFKSFSKQARNSTAGIGTAITVAKTQVVKGITSMIEGLNNGLKKAKLGSLSDIIANIGKQAKKTLDGIAKWLSKIDFKALINVLSKIAPIVLTIVGAFLTYNTVMKTITTATKLFFSVLNANPIGLAITAVVGLTAAFVALANTENEHDKGLKKSEEALKEYKDTMKELGKEKDEALSKSMNEIYYYQSLYDELKTITDENGKVQDGYEERASFITGELSKAFGIEMELQNGVITNYKDIQGEIDNTIEKKKALAYIEAHEKEYNKMLEKENELQGAVEEATTKRNKAEKDLSEYLKTSTLYGTLSKKEQEDLIKVYEGSMSTSKLSADALRVWREVTDETTISLGQSYQKWNKRLEENNKAYADNQAAIAKYRKAQEALAAGNYELVQKIFTDTVEFNGKTKAANDKKYKEAKAGWEEYRKFLQENQEQYDKEYLDSEYARIDKSLQLLDTERNEANARLEQKNTELINTTRTGLNDQLSTIEGYNYEFRDVGNGLMQFYANGEAQGYPVVMEEAQKVTNGVIKKFNSGKYSAEEVGKQITNGLARGISSMGSAAINAAQAISNEVIKEMKKATKVHSPSRATMEIGRYLVLGLNKGINQNINSSMATIDDYANKVTQAFAGGMATNISPQLAASSSLHYSPNVIVNNQMNMRTDPLGQVVGNIKTFANGSKNDYNYGMGS